MLINELEINTKLKKGLKEMGFTELMPIQEKTLSLIIDGKNIIGEAETGTGKTVAFLLPILNEINLRSGNIESIIVAPTRELAMQIVKEIEKVGKYLNITYATLVGGMSIRDQRDRLKAKPSIVVGTLGRINDHLREKKLDLSHVKYFVLDEADEMLKEGFKEDIEALNSYIPDNKHTLLFSATISKTVLKLSKEIMNDYEFITVKDKNSQGLNIEQYYIVMKEKNKFSILTKLLEIDKPTSAIIFGRTKRRADELSKALIKCGYKASGIHGDLNQAQRNAVMKDFRSGAINILVATDVAARGIDVSGISHVYNFDLPEEVEFYVHRIGRTGRAKENGIAYSFIRDTEIGHIERIQEETKMIIKEKSVPSNSELRESLNQKAEMNLQKRLSEIDISKNKEFADYLVKEYGIEKLVGVLINSLSDFTKMNEIDLTGEPPVRSKFRRSLNNRDRGRNDSKREDGPKRIRRRSRTRNRGRRRDN